jgi:ABC-type multidrug transport system fused ATPase/permease subunit
MSGTVFENIAYGRPDAERAAAIEVARRADAHGFIEALPKGYDTRVGERGLLLSGGQRQRLALARALLRDPKILILDEATNAIDSLSEAYIQTTLERLHRQMTIIIIAHRLSTTRNADHVIVLTEGRVIEAGPPTDLIGAGGLYACLYGLQVLNPAIANAAREPGASDRPMAAELRAALT